MRLAIEINRRHNYQHRAYGVTIINKNTKNVCSRKRLVCAQLKKTMLHDLLTDYMKTTGVQRR